MVTLLLGASSPPLGVFVGALVLGAIVGVFGHIIGSRGLILAGILIIGLASAYFSFVAQPGSR